MSFSRNFASRDSLNVLTRWGLRLWLRQMLLMVDLLIPWLSAISRFGGTTSGGPNFAYELCVQKVTAEQRAQLDLSSWEVAFNGAEPVREETLERFAETFEPCGFRRISGLT